MTNPNLKEDPILLKIRDKHDEIKELNCKTEKHDQGNVFIV